MAAGSTTADAGRSGHQESRVVAKAAPAADIVAAIASVAGREGPRPVRPSGLDALTPREAEVLGLVARGLTNDEIHVLLDLSLETVRTHLKHIYAKCGVTDRTHAVIAAYHGGLVAPP
jgi:DNA-binding CsgD family transcriptional regulator